MEVLRVNTVKCQFEIDAVRPTDVEMIKFAINQKLTVVDIHSMHIDKIERCIVIKLNTNEQIQTFLMREERAFIYDSGTMARLRISEVTDIKYVRIFNLPMEMSESDIVDMLKQYGTVKKIVNEKYSAAFGLPVFSTVRGAYMDLRKEIPNILAIRNWRCRIHYAGQKLKCYLCNMEGHVRNDCTQTNQQHNSATISYSDAVINPAPKNPIVPTVNTETEIINENTDPIPMCSDQSKSNVARVNNTANNANKVTDGKNKTISNLSLFTDEEMNNPDIVRDPILFKSNEQLNKVTENIPKRQRKGSK